MEQQASAPTKCPICARETLRMVFPLRDGRNEYRCAACGAFFFWPFMTPVEQKAFYDNQWGGADTAYQDHYCDPTYETHNLQSNFLPRLDLLQARNYAGRILDVGCSVGTFLKAAKERGWEVYGIDLGQSACDRTAAAVGCTVKCGTIDNVDFPDGFFDVIHASQVIEHVEAPSVFLKNVRRLLRPGGALLLAAPIIDPRVYFSTHLLQKYLVPLMSRGRELPYPWAVSYPFHLYAFSPKALECLLAEQDFKPIHHRVVPWTLFNGMTWKWRGFYHAMNTAFRLLGTGMNLDILATRD